MASVTDMLAGTVKLGVAGWSEGATCGSEYCSGPIDQLVADVFAHDRLPSTSACDCP